MRELLAKARKRVIGHLVLDKGALALAIGMGGVVLLLLAGTQILDWYWPVLLALVSLGVGVWQLRKHIPSLYQIAQRIDRRMELADSLSTAVYFSEHPKPGYESVCALQMRTADQLAAGVSLEQALPLSRSKFLIPAAVLFVAASGLFFTRYLMTGSLDLRTSLVEMVVDTFFSSPAEQAEARAKRVDMRPNAVDPNSGDPDAQSEQQLPPDAEKGDELKQDQQNANTSGEDGQGDPNDQNQQQEDGEGNKDGSPQDKQAQQNEREGEDKGDSAPQSQDQRSMMDKLRDAVNNLMNKMGSEDKQQSSKSGKDKQKGQKQDKGSKQDKGDKGDEQGESAEGDPQSAQQGDQANKENAKKSEAPGQKASEDAQSGAGENDGKKDLEAAKTLEAMGKLSELLGQRSTQISGDVMVEVGETKQQLKTAMTQQKAGHTDAGGEIHRDQVPMAYQTFVERYFQEVRKGTEGTAKAGPATSPVSVPSPKQTGKQK